MKTKQAHFWIMVPAIAIAAIVFGLTQTTSSREQGKLVFSGKGTTVVRGQARQIPLVYPPEVKRRDECYKRLKESLDTGDLNAIRAAHQNMKHAQSQLSGSWAKNSYTKCLLKSAIILEDEEELRDIMASLDTMPWLRWKSGDRAKLARIYLGDEGWEEDFITFNDYFKRYLPGSELPDPGSLTSEERLDYLWFILAQDYTHRDGRGGAMNLLGRIQSDRLQYDIEYFKLVLYDYADAEVGLPLARRIMERQSPARARRAKQWIDDYAEYLYRQRSP